jgi:Mnd1 HTH domain
MQPPKRGLSLEEKRSKLLEVFHESKDVFVLKVRCMHARLPTPHRCMIDAQLIALPADVTSDWKHTGYREARRQERHCIAEHQGGAAGTNPLQQLIFQMSYIVKSGCANSTHSIGSPQSLVDDDLVHQEKIGSSNYYWCTQHRPCVAGVLLC